MIFYIRKIKKKDNTKQYLKWLKDYDTIKFTEIRFSKESKKKINLYIDYINSSKNNYLYGIFVLDKKKKIHIGNIKLGPINFNHKFSQISYFIGEKKYLNHGICTKVIKEVLRISKQKFKLRIVYAGCYSNNIYSKKVLIKNGFKLEGVFKNKFSFEKRYVDHLIYSKKL